MLGLWNKMPSIICKSHIKEYCSKCTFAGVHYVADNTKHWIERLFWAVLIILSWYCSALLIIAAWNAFVKSPISFGIETTYIDWETKLPSVAICETINDANIISVSNTLWPPQYNLDLEDVLKDIAFFNGRCYNLNSICFKAKKRDPLCPLTNYSYFASLIRSPCHQILTNCSYNNKHFDCCKYFQPIQTDIGICYIINSIQVAQPNLYPMVSNMKQKRGVLGFEILLPSMVYTLGEDAVPSITTLLSSTLKVLLGNIYSRELTVRDIENDPLLVETTPEQRACRFHHENENGVYPHYSYSACSVRCRKEAQMDICKCNDHFMLGATDAERCNITGMICLHVNFSHLSTLKPKWAERPGVTCDCSPSCNETEITVIKDVSTHLPSRKTAYVEIILSYLPTERFKRNVVRSRLDLVVSVGGTAGLFVGASLLSFVELIFFFTVRFISNVWVANRKNNNNVR